MTELTRTQITESEGRIVRWVVSGPNNAVELETAMGLFTGWFIHSRVGGHGDPASCPILGDGCWSEALSQTTGRDVFAGLLTSEAAVYERLEAEYHRVWPAGGRCGESVPQANIPPNAGSAS